MKLHVVGIDLGKTVFHLVGLDSTGRAVIRKTCSRNARPRKCAPLQASMPINSTCKFAANAKSCLREHFLRITTWPA